MGIGGTCGPSSGKNCGGNSGSGNCSSNKGGGNSRSGNCSANRGSGRSTTANCERSGSCAPPTQVKNANCTPNSCPSVAPAGGSSGQTVQICGFTPRRDPCPSTIVVNGEHRITLCPTMEKVCITLPKYSGNHTPVVSVDKGGRFGDIFKTLSNHPFESFRLKIEAEQRKQEHEAELRRQEHEAEQHRQAQEAELRRLEHEKWAVEHPIEAAEQQLANTINHLSAMEHNKNHAEHLVRESEQRVQQTINEFNHINAKVDGIRLKARGPFGKKRDFVLDEIGNPMCIVDWDRHLDWRRGNIQKAQDELNQRRAHLEHCHHQLHQAIQGNTASEVNLANVKNHLQQQQEALAAQIKVTEAFESQLRENAEKARLQAIETTRINDISEMSKAFQHNIDTANEMLHKAGIELEHEYNEYYSKPSADTLEGAEENDSFAQAQIDTIRHRKNLGDQVLHDRNVRLKQLINERSHIEHERNLNPSSEIQERWFRKEHEINLITHERDVLKHAADVRTEQLNKALFRKSETETHIVNVRNHLTRVNEAEAQRQVAEAAKLNEQQGVQRKTEDTARVIKELIATRAVQNGNSLVAQSGLPSVPALSLRQLAKDVAQTAGQLSGVVVSGVETAKGIKYAIEDPVGAGKALYQFAITDNKIDKINNALAEKLNHIKLEEAKDTIAGSFNAGFEKAKLETDVASLAVGVPGAAKFGATGVQKIASLVGSAHSIPIAGTSITIPGKILGEYSAIKPGPLLSTMAETFSGARYKKIILTEDVIMYRAGESHKPMGQYFSMDRPVGIIQSRIDKSVLPVWPTGAKSKIDTVFEIKIPRGSNIYVGEVGAQESFYIGGTHQIAIPEAWELPGIKVISKEVLE